MNDPDAAPAVQCRFTEEYCEGVARLVLGHAVQVDLIAHGVLAASQLLEDGFGDAFAAIPELIAGFDVEIRRVQRKRIGKHARLVRTP